MTPKRKIAILAPLALVGVMYPVFQVLASLYGPKAGWCLGPVIYWLLWGAALSVLMIGMENIRNRSRAVWLLPELSGKENEYTVVVYCNAYHGWGYGGELNREQ